MEQEQLPGKSEPHIHWAIHHYHEVDSTNRVADEWACQGAPEGTVVLAEVQSRGQGRLERRWLSPCGKGLWFTVILRPPTEISETVPLTLLAAVATTEAIGEYCGVIPEIKWPNDLLVKGKKICGILCEMEAGETVDHVLVGIGINTNMCLADFPEELRSTATSVELETSRPVVGQELLTMVLRHFGFWYRQWLKEGFEPIREAWIRRNGTIGREVLVDGGDLQVLGRAERIEVSGALTVKLEDGTEQTFDFGEVSLRYSERE